MASADLEQSLRAEIEQYIEGRLSGLRGELERLQSQFNEAFARMSERLQTPDLSETDAPVAVAVAEHLRQARNAGIEAAVTESSHARASSDIAILKAAIDDIEQQQTQADILSALVNRAASFAPRIAFFVIKNERATGWRARGLEGTVGDRSVREISLPLSADTLLGETAQTRTTWSGAPGAHAEDHQIYGHFDEEPPQRLVAVPLIAREKAVAVLYADSARQDTDAIGLEALEMLVRVAGMAVELLAARRGTGGAANASAAQPEAAPETVAESSAPPAFAPAHASAQPEAATHASMPFTRDEPAAQPYTGTPQAETIDEAPAPQTFAPAPQAFPSAPPTLAHASPMSAQAPQATAPATSARRSDGDLPIEVSDEERPAHSAARRFARLLVSEIKLYNEQKVRDGLAEGDLYNRLKEDIDRARQTYDNDRRVTPEIAARFDYFHWELVNTLAKGDAGRLGADYPKASLSA